MCEFKVMYLQFKFKNLSGFVDLNELSYAFSTYRALFDTFSTCNTYTIMLTRQ